MEIYVLFPQTMFLKEKVHSANNCIGSFATLSSFIGKKVYLAGDGFTIHPKDRAFAWCQKVDGTRLQRV